MATICGEITDNIGKDCDNKPVGGAKSILRIGNINDVASYTVDSTNPLIIRTLVMKTGKKVFTLTVYKRGHKPKFTKVNKDFGTYWKHEIATSVQVWDNDTKAQIEGLSDAYLFAIVENVQSTGDARFEVYGFGNGMTMADGAVRDLAANDGVFTMSLASDADMEEAHPPFSFAVTASSVYSYSATLTAVTALETPAS